MSHSGNDLIYDTIYDEIVDGLDKLDDKMWEFFNDVSSEHGLHPKSMSDVRLPFFSACFCAATLLNIPRSPDLDSTSEVHSRKNVAPSGLSV